MEFCAAHWSSICNHVRLRNLWDCQLTTKADRVMYIRMLHGQIHPGDNVGLFDAVICTEFYVLERFFDLYGIEEMQRESPHGACPMCRLDATHPGAAARWTSKVAESVRISALNHGLIEPEIRQ